MTQLIDLRVQTKYNVYTDCAESHSQRNTKDHYLEVESR